MVNSVLNAPTTGLPLTDGTLRIVGTPNPDFEFNVMNSVHVGPVALSFQIDWRQGGVFYSHSLAETRMRGLAGEMRDRETELVLPGKKGRLVNGAVVVEGDNDIRVVKAASYYNTIYGILEAQLNNASFVRLREVNLTYELPTAWLKKTLGISAVNLYLTGRNLFLLTKAYVDPELNMANVSGSSPENSVGIELFQQPQTRSLGAGLRIKW